jgi:hypothetical protein
MSGNETGEPNLSLFLSEKVNKVEDLTPKEPPLPRVQITHQQTKEEEPFKKKFKSFLKLILRGCKKKQNSRYLIKR